MLGCQGNGLFQARTCSELPLLETGERGRHRLRYPGLTRQR